MDHKHHMPPHHAPEPETPAPVPQTPTVKPGKPKRNAPPKETAMEITVTRDISDHDTTLSRIVVAKGARNFVMACFGLEDGHRDVKVPGETRIPAGTYKVKLRTHGGFYERYKKRFAHLGHTDGMLEILNVDNFTDILIHIGNSNKDTAGCLLVGETRDPGTMTIGNSTRAYERLYEAVRPAAKDGELTITIVDADR